MRRVLLCWPCWPCCRGRSGGVPVGRPGTRVPAAAWPRRRGAWRGDQTLAAIEDYSGAIVLRPDSMLAHLRRGETYRQRGDLDDAARDFREAASLDPTATRPLEELGDVALPAAAVQGARRSLRGAPAARRPIGGDSLQAGARALSRPATSTPRSPALARATRLDDAAGRRPLSRWRVPARQGATGRGARRLRKGGRNSRPGSIAGARGAGGSYASLEPRCRSSIEQLQVLAATRSAASSGRSPSAWRTPRPAHSDLAVLTLAAPSNARRTSRSSTARSAACGSNRGDAARSPGRDRQGARGAGARRVAHRRATSDVKALYGTGAAATTSARCRRASASAGDRALPGRSGGVSRSSPPSPNG